MRDSLLFVAKEVGRVLGDLGVGGASFCGVLFSELIGVFWF